MTESKADTSEVVGTQARYDHLDRHGEFDHHSEYYAENWREINEDLRTGCPVHRTGAHGGYWVVSKYADTTRVVTDDVNFSSYQELPDGGRTGATIPPGPIRQVPIEMDPPEFSAYRKALNPAFSPAAVKGWEPFIRDVTTACIDASIESGAVDLVNDIAAAVPAVTVLKLLGLPMDNWKAFSDAAHAMVHTLPGEPEHENAAAELANLFVDVAKICAERRDDPREDLISTLVHTEIDGEPITDERLLQTITLVIFGGVDTTGSLLSSVLEWLGRHHDVRAELRDEPELIPQATEEFLRYFSPVQGLARTAVNDCVVGGQEIAAGEQLFMSWASANFDPDVFPDADEVQLYRFPNRHQSFGLGIHRCIGSNLARLEFRVVLEEILRRLPDYEISGEAEHYRSIGVVNGWVNLPATFTPGEREGSQFRV